MDRKHLASALARHLKPHSAMQFLHRFSDSALHTTLMLAIVVLATVTLVKALSVGVAVWILEPVAVQGQSQSPRR